MGTWNMTAGDAAFIEHKLKTARADRLAWMIEEAAAARTARGTASAQRRLATRVASVAAALGGMLLAGPWR